MNILVTCPPMINQINQFDVDFKMNGFDYYAPKVNQTIPEHELIKLVPEFDGWIIGDDQVSRSVLNAGRNGKLRAAIKWGIGVDNVDQRCCEEYGIKFTNTPGMFGREVADIAVGYIIGLARGTFEIDRAVRNGEWRKICGVSLAEKKIGVVGLGDIGGHLVNRLLSMDMKVIGYDPFSQINNIAKQIERAVWPERLNELDFLVFTCALTEENKYIFNKKTITYLRQGIRLVNVSRGALIEEGALISGLKSGIIHSAALDVYENEPLEINSELHKLNCIFGSHNASNTIDAVIKTSKLAIQKINEFLRQR